MFNYDPVFMLYPTYTLRMICQACSFHGTFCLHTVAPLGYPRPQKKANIQKYVTFLTMSQGQVNKFLLSKILAKNSGSENACSNSYVSSGKVAAIRNSFNCLSNTLSRLELWSRCPPITNEHPFVSDEECVSFSPDSIISLKES